MEDIASHHEQSILLTKVVKSEVSSSELTQSLFVEEQEGVNFIPVKNQKGHNLVDFVRAFIRPSGSQRMYYGHTGCPWRKQDYFKGGVLQLDAGRVPSQP